MANLWVTATFKAFRHFAWIAAALTSITGADLAIATDSPQLYEQALRAAVTDLNDPPALKPVPADEKVRVVSWTRYGKCTDPGCTFSAGPEGWWVTLDGEVQTICQQWGLQGDELQERLAQLLGLKPTTEVNYRDSAMVTILVPRLSLLRPCLGETIGIDGLVRCSIRAGPEIDLAFKQFVLDQMELDAAGVKRASGLPFTARGFTYDRHPSASPRKHYGATEFVLPLNTSAELLSIQSTNAYCSGASKR